MRNSETDIFEPIGRLDMMAQTDASRTEIESDQTETLREISTEFNLSNSIINLEKPQIN